MKLSMLLFLFLLGCDGKNMYDPKFDLINYQCDSQQLDLLKKEYDICILSNYTDDYCFKQAKISQCIYKEIRSELK